MSGRKKEKKRKNETNKELIRANIKYVQEVTLAKNCSL